MLTSKPPNKNKGITNAGAIVVAVTIFGAIALTVNPTAEPH